MEFRIVHDILSVWLMDIVGLYAAWKELRRSLSRSRRSEDLSFLKRFDMATTMRRLVDQCNSNWCPRLLLLLSLQTREGMPWQTKIQCRGDTGLVAALVGMVSHLGLSSRNFWRRRRLADLGRRSRDTSPSPLLPAPILQDLPLVPPAGCFLRQGPQAAEWMTNLIGG